MIRPEDDSHIDAERLRLDPGAVFSSPRSLVQCALLSDDVKIDTLRRWYYDAVEIAVAEEEGMPPHEDDLMRDILLALQELAPTDIEHTGPSKHHGLPASYEYSR